MTVPEITWSPREFALQRCTFAAYDAIDAVNWSTLKEMRNGPAAYLHRLAHPLPDKPRFAFGRAVHAACLEPESFLMDFALWRGERRAGKAFRAFEAAHPGETILKAEEYSRCLAMRDAIRSHPVASRLIAGGHAEHAIVWTDPDTGLRCKGRLDYLGGELVELKTTDDLPRFSWFAEKLGYPGQLAFYLRGLRTLGIEVPSRIIAISTRPRHRLEVLTLAASRLEAGERECQRLLRQVAALPLMKQVAAMM